MQPFADERGREQKLESTVGSAAILECGIGSKGDGAAAAARRERNCPHKSQLPSEKQRAHSPAAEAAVGVRDEQTTEAYGAGQCLSLIHI